MFRRPYIIALSITVATSLAQTVTALPVSAEPSSSDLAHSMVPVTMYTHVESDSMRVAFLTPLEGAIDDETDDATKSDAKSADVGGATEKSSDTRGSEAKVTEAKVTELEGSVKDTAVLDGPIVIDNDEVKIEKVTEYQWKEIVDADGRTQIDAGARFPVCVVTSHNSKTAKAGDPVEGVLKVDLKIGGRLVAAKGSKVIGHVSSCKPARKMLHAELSKSRWMRPSGAMAIQFDEIVTGSGDHLPLVAMPARQARIVSNSAEGRVLGVNMNGEIAAPLSGQLKAQGIHLAIRGAASAGGVFSFGAVPLAYGVLGAVNPSFAFMHPVGKNVRHRRIKGFAMGAVSGLPGGFIISDSIISGPEAIIKPGDEFLAELKQSFTGEPASEAELLPNAKVKVHGEVMPESKSKSK